MSFPSYPMYKPSGVDWIGAIPTHWDVSPFKWQIERNDGGVWGDDPDGKQDTIVLRSTEQTVDGHWRMEDPASRKLSESERAAALLSEGDLVVTKSSGSSLHIGKTTIVSKEIADLGCCYSNFMQRVRTKPEFMPKLAWYLMNNDITRLQFDLLSNSTTGLANLNGTMIDQVLVAVPPAYEQTSITAFLDRETAKIDALVEEQKRLIELLKEKRHAVISQAVTKGLDPNVPMKDSGVEWLGEVPAHWPTSRLANLYSDTDERGNDDLPVLTVSIHDGVSDDELDEADMDRKVTRSEDKTKYKRVQPGDLVYNMMRAWQGGFGTVTVDGMVSPAYVVARPRTPFPTAFIESILRTPNAIEEMRGRSRGVTDFRLRLYWEEFKEIVVPLPPKAEVEAILEHLREWNSRVADTVSAAEDCISILQERRSALISAAITGKIDVRGLAPQPEGAAA